MWITAAYSMTRKFKTCGLQLPLASGNHTFQLGTTTCVPTRNSSSVFPHQRTWRVFPVGTRNSCSESERKNLCSASERPASVLSRNVELLFRVGTLSFCSASERLASVPSRNVKLLFRV